MKRHFKLLASVLLVLAMVFAFASCDLLEQYIPGLHKHDFIEGKCECGETDPDYVHTHNFTDGKCECGELEPGYSCIDHVWGDPVLDYDATCTDEGRYVITCTVCGYQRYTPIFVKDHTEESIPGYAASCDEPGLTEGKKCTVCGKITVEQEEIPAEHTAEEVPGRAPTCTVPGLTPGYVCSVCGEVLTAQTELPLAAHNYVDGKCECGVYAEDYTGPKTYVLDVQKMTAFAAGAKADGDFDTFGLDDFYTIYYSAKTKVDTTKNKEWSDGYAFAEGLRLNFGGTTSIGETTKNAIKIVVNGTATVKIWWICGGDGREVGIFDENGNLVVASSTDDVFAESEGVGPGKNGVYLSELTISKAGTYYIGTDNTNATKNGGNIFCKIETTVTPSTDAPASGSIDVETTDTYSYIDEYTFTAAASGTYTFTLPAGLGLFTKEAYNNFGDPVRDFYDADGAEYTFNVELAEGATYDFLVGALTKGHWTITWTFTEGEIGGGEDGPTITVDTELELGVNSVYVTGGFGASVDCIFVVTEEGTYTFASGTLMAVITMADGSQVRGQAYLTAGTYNVTIVSYASMDGYYDVNVEFAAPATGEPDGSEQFPFIWEALPESVTFVSDNMNMVYYLFTATADGSVTFTWAVEGNDWFNCFELVDGDTTDNNASGFAKTSHTFVVEAGKTYRVGLGTWNEGGETVVSIAFNACAHVWSEATCTAPATCTLCGGTTGDKAEHIPSTDEPTCANPAVCTVCGFELSYVPHTYGEPVVITPANCATETMGLQSLTCTVCGHVEEEEIYYYHDWVVDVEIFATCTTDGKYSAHCSVCNVVDAYDITAQGHYNYLLACGESGECMECGETFTLEHSGDPATCTEPAFCWNCWQSYGEPAGHKYDETGLCTECYLTHTLVIAGNDGFFGSNWSLEDINNLLDYDYDNFVFTKSYKCLATGIHQFKVVDITNGNNWDNAYPSQNFFFFAKEGDEVVISIDLKTKTVGCTVNGVAATGTLYLVVGDSGLCGDIINTENEGWGWELENYANLLTLNAEGKYELVYTGVKAGSYGIKVVKNCSWGNGNEWGDNGQNYVINVDADNSVVTITFDPATGISHSVHAHTWSDATCKEPQKCECGATQGELADHVDANGDFKCDVCSTKMLPADGTALTIPQALAIAKLGGSAYTSQKYYITGIVTNVYNTTYGNLYLKDDQGNQICIYGLYTWNKAIRYDKMEYKPVEGDELTVYTVLGTYNSTPQGKDAWMDEVVAHEHNYVSVVTDPTCVAEGFTTHTCSICMISTVDTKVEALGHTTDNGVCGNCGLTIGGDAPVIGELAVFDFGANGSASHVDGNDLGTSKTYTSGTQTLALTGMYKVYGPAYDAKGNSCIKLGTSSTAGKFSFTVGEEVTEVVIYVAKYKSNTTKITVNGTSYTISGASNSGAYDAIVIDTTVNKTVNFATVSGGVRCMINKIVFNGVVA